MNKDFQKNKPYIPSNRFPDRPISKQIIKTDDTILSAAMVSIINTNNPTDILNFFQTNLGASYKDKEGNTPIHLIIQIEDNKLNQTQKKFIIEKLMAIPYSVSIDTPNNKMETPLHMAITRQLNIIIELLLKYGANPNSVNSNHQNALHLALIPNIQPCEKKKTPDPIINIESSVDDKNTIFNEVLSVFYNYRKDYQPAVEIIKFHAANIDNFYEDFKQSDIKIINNKIVNSDTQIDKSLKNIQNEYNRNITNINTTKSEIKKNISYQTIKSVQNITTAYEDFIKLSLGKINLENRDLLDLAESDIETICKHLLSTNASDSIDDNKIKKSESIDDIEQQLTYAKNKVRDKIYGEIDTILNKLNSNYKWKRTDKERLIQEMPKLDHLPNAPAAAVDFDTTLTQLKQSFEDKYYFIRNTRNEYENYLISRFNLMGFGPLDNDQQKRVKQAIKNSLFLDDNDPRNNDNKCLNLFIYLYGSNLYSDYPDVNIRDKIIQYYNVFVAFV